MQKPNQGGVAEALCGTVDFYCCNNTPGKLHCLFFLPPPPEQTIGSFPFLPQNRSPPSLPDDACSSFLQPPLKWLPRCSAAAAPSHSLTATHPGNQPQPIIPTPPSSFAPSSPEEQGWRSCCPPLLPSQEDAVRQTKSLGHFHLPEGPGMVLAPGPCHARGMPAGASNGCSFAFAQVSLPAQAAEAGEEMGAVKWSCCCC